MVNVKEQKVLLKKIANELMNNLANKKSDISTLINAGILTKYGEVSDNYPELKKKLSK